jgi:uncharacterized surface protein with fasciclin (FAS1) repeats
MHRRRQLVLAGLAALTVGLAACSSSGKSSSGSSSSSSPTSAAATSAATTSAASTAAAASGLFGPGCAQLGLTDALVAPAAQAPVGVVAAGVPFLKNVVTAATAAGLVPTLNAAPALTVFTPTDTAFKKEPAALLQSLLTDPSKKPQLIATLKYNVLGEQVTKDQLTGTHKTLEGKNLTITGSGDNYVINGTAHIICGGLKTKNAIVYITDAVLHPPA